MLDLDGQLCDRHGHRINHAGASVIAGQGARGARMRETPRQLDVVDIKQLMTSPNDQWSQAALSITMPIGCHRGCRLSEEKINRSLNQMATDLFHAC